MIHKKQNEDISKGSNQIFSFYFSSGSLWLYGGIALVTGIAFYWHGHNFHNHSSLIFSLLCIGYLFLSLCFAPKPPKAIHLDFEKQEISVENRWPQEVDKFKVSDLSKVECYVRPRRFAVTELVFHFTNGSRITYLYDVSTTGSFFGLPKEVPNKEVEEFVLEVSNLLNKNKAWQ